MSVNGQDFERSTPLTEDVFLETLATRICEKLNYDIGKVDPVIRALSDRNMRQVKSKGSSHKPDLSFYDALTQKNRGIAKIVRDAQNDIVPTLTMTRDVRGREQIFQSLEDAGSATFGQELSGFIDNAMAKKMTGKGFR